MDGASVEMHCPGCTWRWDENARNPEEDMAYNRWLVDEPRRLLNVPEKTEFRTKPFCDTSVVDQMKTDCEKTV